MTTETKQYGNRCTKAIDKNPGQKGGSVGNGLSGKEPMYGDRYKYDIERHDMPTDVPDNKVGHFYD